MAHLQFPENGPWLGGPTSSGPHPPRSSTCPSSVAAFQEPSLPPPNPSPINLPPLRSLPGLGEGRGSSSLCPRPILCAIQLLQRVSPDYTAATDTAPPHPSTSPSCPCPLPDLGVTPVLRTTSCPGALRMQAELAWIRGGGETGPSPSSGDMILARNQPSACPAPWI